MKRTGKTPRFKAQRRVLTELPGLGKPGALERRPYPPGEHGQKRRKYSEYALQLEEKQKLRLHYVLEEKQLRRFVHIAKAKADINWVSQLVSFLERRIDNVVFRLGFAPSIRAARQLISHRKVLVNGRRLTIKSALVNVGDEVMLVPEAYTNQVYLQAKAEPRLPLPDYLSKREESLTEIGRLTDEPSLGHLPFAFDPGKVTSYYALKG